MAGIKLDDLLKQDEVVLPKYLVVTAEGNELFENHAGDTVFEVHEDRINRMVLAEDKVSLVALKDPEVVIAGNDIIFKKNTVKDPIQGLNRPTSVQLKEGDNKARALLDVFREFMLGMFSVHAVVLATDVVAIPNETSTPAETAPQGVKATAGVDSVTVEGE